MGRIGVKVWIYKGDIIPEVKEEHATAETGEVSQGT
jgi:ribosomal protein S3